MPTDVLDIPTIEWREAMLHVKGQTPLIAHQWSERAKQELIDKVTGAAKKQRAPIDPNEEFRQAAYVVPGQEDAPDWKPGKYNFPSSAFKHAYLYGVGQLNDVKRFPKTKATGWVTLVDDPVLEFEKVILRIDIARNPTQPIFRPSFIDWGCNLYIVYNSSSVSIAQVVNLFNHGGVGGIGDWRPTAPQNKSGNFGKFEIDRVET